MSTPLPEPSAQPQKNNEAERMRYVEELAGPEDAWVSITDAARITRSSEAMARRWVTSGRLPVKRLPVGLNQQTRLVRLSDLATIRPIIDPAAAISDEIRRVDLPSIPRQQAQLMQDHQRLLLQVQEGQRVASELRTSLLELAAKQQQEVAQLGQHLSLQQDEWRRADQRLQQQQETLAEQIREQAHHLAAQERQHQQDLEQLRTVLMSHLQEVRAEAAHTFDHLEQSLRDQNNQMRYDLTTLLQQQEERIQHQFQETEDRHEQAHKQIRAEWQEGLAAHRQALIALVEQHMLDYRRDLTAWTSHLEEIEQRLEQVVTRTEAVCTTLQGYQKQADTQEQVLATLTEFLQEERAARKTLAEQMATQQEQVQVLHREIADWKHTKTQP
jgi:hypothetical protein